MQNLKSIFSNCELSQVCFHVDTLLVLHPHDSDTLRPRGRRGRGVMGVVVMRGAREEYGRAQLQLNWH